MNVGAASARPVVVQQPQGQLLQRRRGDAAQQGRPQLRPVAREPPEHTDVRMARHAQPMARAPGRLMPDEPEQAHEREEGLAGDLARAKRTVQLERGERLRRGGQAEARISAVDMNPDEGIQERKRAGDVPPRAQGLDEPDLGERRIELGRAGLPLDALGRSHQRATLAILLGPARRPVLGQPASEVAGLADVEETAGGVVDAIDARLVWDFGEEVGAKLLVEGPHGSLSQRACRSTKHLCRHALRPALSPRHRSPCRDLPCSARSRSKVKPPVDGSAV